MTTEDKSALLDEIFFHLEQASMGMAQYRLKMHYEPPAPEVTEIQSIFSTQEILKLAHYKPTNQLQKTHDNGILFTEQEINKMPKEFRKIYRTQGYDGLVRQKLNGVYEIRDTVKGKRVSASGKTLQKAKDKFNAILKRFVSVPEAKIEQLDTFSAFGRMWLVIAKKPFLKEGSYSDYETTFTKHLEPQFGQLKIKDIKTSDIQAFINIYIENNKYRTAKKIRLVAQMLFDYAVGEDIINKSPVDKVKRVVYEQKTGRALTLEEEKIFIEKVLQSNLGGKYALLLLLFTGMRRGELDTAIFKDNWISVITGKQRKGYKEKRREIPITPQLRKYLTLKEDFLAVEEVTLTDNMSDLLPGHKLHNLRHTFTTRCQECGVPQELVSVWVGHSSKSLTGKVYTHYSEVFQLTEAQKVSYDL